MTSPHYNLETLCQLLVNNAYPEISEDYFSISIGNVRSYGQVRWSSVKDIEIKCHKEILTWPEPVVLGLLSHELSHPVLGQQASEMSTDNDVIKRGLGHYLAAERAYVGKSENHVIANGKDMYLGFQSIYDLLNPHERKLLNFLLEDFNIAQSSDGNKEIRIFHDTSIYESSSHAVLRIEGRIVQIPSLSPGTDVKLLFRERQLIVYVEDEIVDIIDWDDS